MKIKIGTLRKLIREAILDEEAWVPGRYYPGNEPLAGEDRDRLNQPVGEGEDEMCEVDTDPANNPGRPADAFEYVGMRPNPEWALAHPSLGGGVASAGDGEGVEAGEEPQGEPTA